ncbi:penicillin-binding protein 2 [Sulfurirhabdus autotrophica]|uniref:Peptidoglycan D,D-transpeptidase MrdA n=1 Tax=Sulfurirhabdus autotrophica TaxID=1706046 RepID=A0A4R3Y7A6_9PROT|nr:penicillin-binding protein 2 [Sulfurirhabdus autotrophica]TCV88175.1 peptidoglycan glycosyltransferase /cell elongation-specific peptidoglycan D,D-transpeptidase [Sulfurirhabdus autotrophica]
MKHRTFLKNHKLELHSFRIRLAIGGAFAVILFLVLASRFFYVQVAQHNHYQTLAEANRISIVPIVPNRGLILDRNGVILAHNYSAYTLEITPSKVDGLEATIDELAKIIEITSKDRKRFKKLLDESHNFESQPIRTRLNEVEIARFAVNRYRFPGVEIKARLFRDYPLAELASHAIGYIGRINDKDLDKLEENEEIANYRGSDHIGKIGIEQSYEKQLHGITGFEQVETDSGGKAIRTLSRTPAVSGDNVYLAMDTRLQAVAEKAFGDFRGAMVAIDPHNGEVLAFVSQPGFDPNLFVDGIDSASWDALNNSPDRPLNNRALRGLYPPGSTFKPFMALAGLELGKRTPSSTISDPGYYMLPGSSHRYRDWKAGGHGSVDLRKSIVVSCDTYYYGLANDMGIDNIYNFIKKFGMGSKTGIDIEGEVSGLLASQEWKKRRFKQRWFPGETVITGIGQGYTLTTPLQLAFATSLLANSGELFPPRLVRAIQDSKSNLIKNTSSQPLEKYDFKPENLKLVREAMIDVNRPGGTAVAAWLNAPYLVAGKTGTAQVVGIKQTEKYVASRVQERHRDHALYIAYAPADDPKIALAVLVENGGHGGSTAAPIARKVMDFYLLGKLPNEPKISTEAAAVEEHADD